MKYTLLKMSQDIASSMDSDEFNSITDSTEALQIATVVKTAYLDIISRANLPEHYSFVNLTPSTDPLLPVVMYVPDTVNRILWLKYDTHTTDSPQLTMTAIPFKKLENFLVDMYAINTTDSDVVSGILNLNSNTVPVLFHNDRAPSCYTSFDDRTLLFDAYDASVDTTLQASKSLAYAHLTIPWTMADTFVPPLDDAQFALLLNEAKSLAWAELKQTAHAKAERNAQRGWTVLQKNQHETEEVSSFDRLPYYGRK